MNAPAQSNNDATLKSCTSSLGKAAPSFWSGREEHAVLYRSDTETATFTATASDPRAAITLGGKPLVSGQPSHAVPVPVGKSSIAFEVTAADGTTKKTYKFKLVRAYPRLNWTRVLEHAPFTARDSAGEIHHNNQMVVLGGYIPELVNDVWASANGKDWKQIGNVPSEAGINVPVAFSYAGKMWISTQDGNFFNSTDGKDWTLVTDKAPWRKRYCAGSAVFAGKMWVAGGAGGEGTKGTGLHNDLWSSTDGINWKLELAHAPWSPRQLFGNLVVHNGKLFVVGGGVVSYQPFRAYSDVWSSPDGINWSLETEEAPFASRIWSSVLSYHGRLWLLGGFEAEPRWTNFNDVWYSVDGKKWNRLNTEDIWSERHEVSPYVHDEKLWVVAGNAWPLVNDVWRLALDKLVFITHPVNEEYALAKYRYAAVADFNKSASPVTYRLVAGPSWLKLASNTGVLTGTPPAAGDHVIELEARDESGETATQKFTLHVLP